MSLQHTLHRAPAISLEGGNTLGGMSMGDSKDASAPLAWPQQPLAIALGLLVYGAAMEVAQSFTTHRFGDPWDWLADAVGLLVLLPFALRRRRLG